MKETLIRSKERVKKYAEVFTPSFVVKQMCDMLENESGAKSFDVDSRILDPTCGNGNFLVEILERKLAYVNNNTYLGLFALASTYGVDILEDNVIEARQRLHDLFVSKCAFTDGVLDFVDEVLSCNIILGDFLKGINPKTGETFYFCEWSKSDDVSFLPKPLANHSLEDIQKCAERSCDEKKKYLI